MMQIVIFIGILMGQYIKVPTIWGDGVHDDTAGIEALVCKQWFRYRPGAVLETEISPGQKYFLLPLRYKLQHGLPIPPPGTGPHVAWLAWTETYEIAC